MVEGVQIGAVDAEAIAQHAQTFVAIAADVPGEYWGVDNLLVDLPRKWELSAAAWAEGRPVGYAVVSWKRSGPHLHHLMVASSWRNRGLGSQLIADIERRANAAGASTLSLKVGRSNLAALRFYQRLGYRITSEDDEHLELLRVLGSAHGAGVADLGNYRELVGTLLELGYSAVTFEEVEPASRHMLLRHDLDMATAPAVEIAWIEHELGVRATYCVMTQSELYNPWTPSAEADLRRIVDLGHDIGLHFDPALVTTTELVDAVDHAAKGLEAIVGQRIDVVSFHRPPANRLGVEVDLGGRLNTYGPRYFEDIGYCSDSRGRWSHGRPETHQAVGDGRALQLLTHPIWWTAAPGEDVQARLDRLSAAHAVRFRSVLAANCDVYRMPGP